MNSQDILFYIVIAGVSLIIFLLFFFLNQSKHLKQELLELSHQHFALNQHAIVSIADALGCIIYVNDKFCEISGFSRNELIGKTHAIVNSGFHETRFFEDMWQTISQGKVWYGDVKNKRKSGEYYWVSASVVPIFDQTKKITQYISIRTDITTKKRLEEQLIENEYFLKGITSTMAQGVYAMDTGGLCTFWNKEAERILGWSHSDLLGKGVHNIIHFQDAEGNSISKEQCPTQKSILRNEIFKSETDVFTHKDGRVIPISITAVPLIESDQVIGSVAVFNDISIRVEAEQRLKAAREVAEQANETKSAFLANMSHEIRTPMNGIIGMTELALDTDLDREQREYLEIVKDSSHALLTIINDILDFSKIEAGKLELENIEFNLHDLLKETTKTLSVRAYEKGLEMILDISPVVPSVLYGDPGRLRQVLTNLLGNAIKFTEQGEITLSVFLQIGGNKKSCLQFDVMDTGIGISFQRQQSIFDSFSQEDSSVSRKYGGTGLGLTISKQLIDLMGGDIWLESQQGEGSTFIFTAWFEHQDNNQVSDVVAGLKDIPVLLVDDNESNRQVIDHLLSQWGMQVVSFATQQQVFEELSQPRFNYKLLLVDSVLDGYSGFELVKQLQTQQLYNGAVLMLLASGMDSKEIKLCQAMKLSGYIVKPMSHSDILDELHSVFDASVISAHIQTQKVEPILDQPFNILVAEDNVINQQLAKGLLNKRGYKVSIANNGIEAIEMFKSSRYDLILMDFQMPEMDGLESTKRIRALEKDSQQHIPIIAMTANAMQEDREMALAAGMDDYLSKPIDAIQLFDTIKRNVEKRRIDQPKVKLSVSGKTCNWESALTQLAGDKEILEVLATMFIEQHESYLQKINNALNEQDWPCLGIELHSLKGVCSTLGADKLEQLIIDIESLLDNGQEKSVESGIVHVEQEIVCLIDELKSHLS